MTTAGDVKCISAAAAASQWEDFLHRTRRRKADLFCLELDEIAVKPL